MLVAKIKGNLVCTRKHEKLVGQKLLIIQPVNQDLAAEGMPFVGIDAVQAGPGDLALVARHGSAVKVICDDKIPANAIVVGIIDEIYRGE